MNQTSNDTAAKTISLDVRADEVTDKGLNFYGYAVLGDEETRLTFVSSPIRDLAEPGYILVTGAHEGRMPQANKAQTKTIVAFVAEVAAERGLGLAVKYEDGSIGILEEKPE